jgi:hypothetical protein
MRKRLILSYLVLLFSLLKATAQYYDTGQDPASLKWLEIKTGRFSVIYPESYGARGPEYAKALEDAYMKLVPLFPGKKIKIPVVIHNYTVQSNGYVAWAPKRMELYPTPEQNGIPLAQQKQLAVHEMAHVLQMESLNQGFTRGMSFLLGQQAIGIVSALLPLWFLEGDAVFAETILTTSGRGRSAAFQKKLKALITEGEKKYKYDKILNGSYRDFIPDYYETGYQMVSRAMLKSDPQIWNKVLKFTAQQPFSINPVNISLSANAGLRKKTLWDYTYLNLRNEWGSEIEKNQSAEYDNVNPGKNGKYINYYSPVHAGHDSIIAIKTSLTDPPSFVLINQKLKTEKRIHTPGNLYPRFISCGNGKVVWVETQADLRWANREYSIIKLLDIHTGNITKLSHRSRYMAAALSPDNRRVAALENTVGNINNLVLINTSESADPEILPSPGNIFLQHPQWSADGKKISFIFLEGDEEGIISFDTGSRRWQILIDPGREDLQSSYIRNDSLFFVSSASGTENLYLLTPDKKTSALTNARYGATDVSPAGNNFLFSNYTILGNDICVTSPGAASSGKNNVSSFIINRFEEKPESKTDSISTTYTPVRYRKLIHPFRFHSWMPFYADLQEVQADPSVIRPGVTLLTQNTLSTLISSVGYEYSAENRHVFHTHVTWQGIYPVFETQLYYGNLPVIDKRWQNVTDPSVINPGFGMFNTVSLPLRLTSGKFSEFLRPSLSIDYKNHYIFNKERGTYNYGQAVFIARLFFSNYHVSAYRDIYPRWAQIVDFNYCWAPFDKSIYGSTVSVKTAFYFPGIFPNNGIKIRLEAEKQKANQYFYRFYSSFPRGYNDIISKEIRFFSTDYVFPVMYPDLSVGSLLYLKRIRTGLFFDYAEGPGNSMYKNSSRGLTPLFDTSDRRSFSSYGIELLGDFHILRIPYTISGGVQAAWKNLNEAPVFGVLFNIDLYGMTLGKRKL